MAIEREYQMPDQKYFVSVESVVAIIDQLLPCLDPAKTVETFGEHKVFFSDQSESPELYVEYNLLENTPKYGDNILGSSSTGP